MSLKEVKVEFQQEKYEVLAYFLKKEGQEIEPLMKEYLDKIYQKSVPKQTRDYIGFKIGEEQTEGQEQETDQVTQADQNTQQDAQEQGDVPASSDTSTGRSTRRTRRAAAQNAEPETESQAQDTPEQQDGENQEPQMSM